MELQIVSFELAKKLKEIGFNEKSQLYNSSGYIQNCPSYFIKDLEPGADFELWYAPTQALAQMWFRENHSIDISLDKFGNNYTVYVGTSDASHNNECVYINGKDQFEYKEALEAGLFKACELIKV